MITFHDHLQDTLVPIDQVRQHEDNPNSGDVDAIAESMMVNGVYAGVIAQVSTGRILAGNHRYAALLSLGEEQIPVHWVDVSDEGAKRIMLADNRTTRLGRDNEHDLLAVLKDLEATEQGLLGTGFTIEDMAQIATPDVGFALPQTQPGLYQIVIDFTDEDEATRSLAELQTDHPDARMVFL